jgi:MoxR-like ATPase
MFFTPAPASYPTVLLYRPAVPVNKRGRTVQTTSRAAINIESQQLIPVTALNRYPMATVDVKTLSEQLEANIGSVVLGKPEAIRSCLVALLAGEHLLVEDVPGVGKTLLGKALARSLEAKFTRLQFTPDLLPSDIVGGSVYQSTTGEFHFQPGPIFANIVMADEINRAPPRTQSALLESMSEGQVSVDGVTHDLPVPFMVIATQNPYEFEGTYNLPENQLDRFLMRISLGYPARADEREVLISHRQGEPVDELSAVLTVDQVCQLQAAVREIRVDDAIYDYVLDITTATRESEDLVAGVSPRGAISLYRAAQALALVEGREFVVPDDIKRLAVPVLSHRVIGRGVIQGARRNMMEELVLGIVNSVAVPG